VISLSIHLYFNIHRTYYLFFKLHEIINKHILAYVCYYSFCNDIYAVFAISIFINYYLWSTCMLCQILQKKGKVLLIKIRNWIETFFFIWSDIKYDINSQISFTKYLYLWKKNMKDITCTVVDRTLFKAQTVSLALLTSSISFFSWGKQKLF
jgi:hypothetical protein